MLGSVIDGGALFLSRLVSTRRHSGTGERLYVADQFPISAGTGAGILNDPGEPPPAMEKKAARVDVRPYQNLSTAYSDPDVVRMKYLQGMARMFSTPASCIDRLVGRLRLHTPIFSMEDKKAAPEQSAIDAATRLWKYPDPSGDQGWREWISFCERSMQEVDGVAILLEQNNFGEPFGLKPLDPATILINPNKYGDTPFVEDEENAAYRQVIRHGTVQLFTRDDLWFAKRNPLPGRLYGESPTERAAAVIVGGIFEVLRENRHLEQNQRKLIGIQAPKDTQKPGEFREVVEQIEARLNSSEGGLVKVVPLPNTTGVHEFEGIIFDLERSETRRRDVAYAYGLNPAPLVRDNNRGTSSEQSKDEDFVHADILDSWEKEITWLTNVILGTDFLKCTLATEEKTDELKRAQAQKAQVQSFVRRPSELRKDDGIDEWEAPDLDRAALGMAPEPEDEEVDDDDPENKDPLDEQDDGDDKDDDDDDGKVAAKAKKRLTPGRRLLAKVLAQDQAARETEIMQAMSEGS